MGPLSVLVMWFVFCSSRFVVVTEAEWNTLSKFYSADQDITVKRDVQSNTLVTHPGEYFYLRQDHCSRSHQVIFLAYYFSINHKMDILRLLFQATTFHHCHLYTRYVRKVMRLIRENSFN